MSVVAEPGMKRCIVRFTNSNIVTLCTMHDINRVPQMYDINRAHQMYDINRVHHVHNLDPTALRRPNMSSKNDLRSTESRLA